MGEDWAAEKTAQKSGPVCVCVCVHASVCASKAEAIQRGFGVGGRVMGPQGIWEEKKIQ